MSTFSDTSPILIKKRKGDSTDPFKPITENLKIINNVAILNEIPDNFRRVNIEGMIEKRTDFYNENNSIAENEYIVDYKLGYVFFNEKMNDKTVKAEYLGIGVVLYPSSRIYDTGRKDVIVTIQEMIDGGRKAIEAYSSIDKAIEVAKDYYVKISTANEEAKQINETLNITIVNGKTINDILNNSIKEATDIDTTLNKTIVNGTNKIVEMDEKLKEIEEISTKTSSTIETAKQTNEVLNKTIVNGKNTDDILNESIRKSTDIHNILNGSVISGTNKIVEIDNKTKEVNLNEENRVTEEIKRVDAEKIRESNESSRQIGYINMQNTVDNFSICEEYNPNKEYKKFNRVTLNGSSYECIKDCQGILPTDINNWVCIAKKGQDGTGTGNMHTDDWDRDADGIIDFANDSNKLGGKLANEYALKSEVSSNVNIKPFKSTIILEEESNRIKIGISEFNVQIDELLVYQNGIYIEKDKEYKISLDGLYIEKISGNWNKDTIFNFVMYKGVKDKIEYEDGALILDGSITFNKLNLDIQNKINNTNRNNIERKTYTELTKLIAENKLETGGIYLLTDYYTIYIQPISNSLHIGDKEELYLTATSTNTLSPIAYSKKYPQDIILYDVNNNMSEDKATPRNGFIIWRKDTINGNEAPYDFRYIVWVRYKVHATKYLKGGVEKEYSTVVPKEPVTKGTVYKVDNKLYLAHRDMEAGSTVDINNKAIFALVVPDMDMGFLTHGDLQIDLPNNTVLQRGSMTQVPTFGEVTSQNKIHGRLGDLTDNVIYGRINGSSYWNYIEGSHNTIGYSCSENNLYSSSLNTLIMSSRSNYLEHSILNFLGEDCDRNTLRYTSKNRLVHSCLWNTLIHAETNTLYINSSNHEIQGNNNIFNFGSYKCSLSIGCVGNIIGINSGEITLGQNSQKNVFDNYVNYINFAQSCSNNTLAGNCKNIAFFTSCFANTLGEYCANITMENSCRDNKIGHHVTELQLAPKSSNNTLGENCSIINIQTSSGSNIIPRGTKLLNIQGLKNKDLTTTPYLPSAFTKHITINGDDKPVMSYIKSDRTIETILIP